MNPLTPATLTHLESAASRLMASEPLTAVALSLTDRERTLHVGVYGHVDRHRSSPLSAGHLLQIGSIGKSFTALALLRLHERGALDLHAPVTATLPWLEIPSDYEPITAHHLLTHTAGLPTGTEESPSPEGEAWMLRRCRAAYAPGAHFHYSNTGYKILGLMLEKLTGEPYARAVRDLVLDPLGMRETEPVITYETLRRHPTGYLPYPPNRPVVRPFKNPEALLEAPRFESATADGCISSTPGDMAVYARALLNGFAGLLQAETFKRMAAPHALVSESNGATYAYGYGLDVVREGGELLLAHGGGMVGYTAHILANMDAGLGAAVLLNGMSTPGVLARFALQTARAGRAGEALPPLPERRGEGTVDKPEDYSGEYEGPAGRFTVVAKDGGLWLEEYALQLVPHGGEGYLGDHAAFGRRYLRFVRDEEGSVIGFDHGPDIYRRRGAAPAEFPGAPARWAAFEGRYAAQNPWLPEFSIYRRAGALVAALPYGEEAPLSELEDGVFRLGEAAHSPERLRFKAVVDGRALIAEFSGTNYYRMFELVG